MPRLTLADIESLRAKSAPLSMAVAAPTSSDSYKSDNSRAKPLGKSLARHLSIESRNFHGSALKKSANQLIGHRVIPLGTGRPTAELYPWDSITFHEEPFHADRSRIVTPNDCRSAGSKPSTVPRRGTTYDLARGLNYGHAAGSQPLVRFITEHVEIVHDPPYQNWQVCLSCGSTSALEIALRIFCNRGDTVLMERYTYLGMIEVAGLVGLKPLGIDMDDGGLDPNGLRSVLSQWDGSQGPLPKILYVISSGQNPTGSTQSPERREEIYQIAEDYDLVIIEDDPYYFLQVGGRPIEVETSNDSPQGQPARVAAYLSGLLPSFLSLDQSGRLIRLDSASKILAPGLRAGWVTASDEIIDKFISYQEVSTVAVSGATQLMLYSLLEIAWGHSGLFLWLENLSLQYRNRLDALLKASNRFLPRDICSWVVPQNGMFIWIALDLFKHPILLSEEGKRSDTVFIQGFSREIEARISSKALERGVQVTKGSLFDANRKPGGVLYIRLTYAAANECDFGEGIEKLADTIKEEFQ